MKSAFPRKRAVQACRMCRHRRTKCDNGRPSCSMCLTLSVECIYGETNDIFDPGSVAILKRLDGLEQLIRAGKTEDLSRTASNAGPSTQGSPYNAPNLTARGVSDTAEYRYHVNVESMLQWPVFEHQNIDQRVNLKSLFDPVHGSNFGLQWSPPDPEIHSEEIDNALQKFLDNVHVFNPIFEEAHLREQLRTVRSNGLGWDPESCLLLLACAVGAISERTTMDGVESSAEFRTSTAFETAELYFFSAQKRMGPLLCDRSVIAAQCFYLAGYYMSTSMRPLEAWKLLIQSLACCQSHHNAISVMTEDHHERCQSQQRIYWATFKAELEICLELDLAQDSINNLAYPTFFPSPPECLANQLRVGWYFYLSDIAIRRLKNRSLNYIYHCERSHITVLDMAQEIANLEREAEGLCTMLPLELQPGTRDLEDEIDQPRSTLAKMRVELQMHLLDCYEIMYWPFIVNLVSDEARDVTTSLGFASKAISIAIDRIQKSRERHRHRQYASWLILRRATRSALLLFAANLTPQLKQILPPNWKAAAFMVIQMLRYWADELKDVKNRLSILETLMRNVETSCSTAMDVA